MAVRKKKPEVVYNWHPNFRLPDTLPDIKQVRTGFIVNFFAIVFAVASLWWLLSVEVDIHNINAETNNANNDITANTKANNTNISNSKKFISTSKPLQSVVTFTTSRISPLDVLSAVETARPDNMLFDSVAVEPQTLEIKGHKPINTQRIVVSGTFSSDTRDLKGLNDFVEKVLTDPVIKDHVDPTRTPQIEDPQESPGIFRFTITIILKPAA